MPVHKVTEVVVTEKMLPCPDTCSIVENLRMNVAEQDKRRRVGLEKVNAGMSKRRQSLPVLPSYFVKEKILASSLPTCQVVKKLCMNSADQDKGQRKIILNKSETEMRKRVQSLTVLSSHPIIGSPKEKKSGAASPTLCLVENLRMNGAEEDKKQRRLSLERIKIQMCKRKQSLPLLPSHLIIISPTREKGAGKNDKKDVTFQLPVGVLMEQVVTEGEVDELKDIIEKHGKKLVDLRVRNGVPLILRAILEDHMDCLKVLLAAGANTSARDEEGWNMCHVASVMDNIAAAKIILEAEGLHKGLTQSRNIDGDRAIDLAESLEMSRLLLRADLAEFRLDCNTVEEHTSYTKKSEAKVLQHIKECFEIHATSTTLNEVLKENTCYSSLLHLAATKNYTRLADYVCTHSVPSLEVRDKKGWTPLHTAVYYNNIDMALFLVDRGANIHAITHSYRKPSDLTQHELILSLMEGQQTYTA